MEDNRADRNRVDSKTYWREREARSMSQDSNEGLSRRNGGVMVVVVVKPGTGKLKLNGNNWSQQVEIDAC